MKRSKSARSRSIPTAGTARKFVTDVKAKDAHPIVLSLTVRNIWDGDKVERGSGSGRFGRWSQEVADAEKVPFVDVTNIIADEYEKMGQEKITPLFPVDHTHTNQAGADVNASLIVAGLKGIRSLLAQFRSPTNKGVAEAAAPGFQRVCICRSHRIRASRRFFPDREIRWAVPC